MKLNATLTTIFTLSVSIIFGQNYTMDASLTQVNDCSGFFLDSGGSGPYGPNENFVTTICPQGTGGTHVQLVFSSPQIEPGDELCFFDGPDVLSPSLGCVSDFTVGAAFIIQATAANPSGCLTLTFNSDASGEGDGWSADINCIPACQTILSVLDHSDPAVEPVDTGWIDICPGDRVFFWGRGAYPQNNLTYNHSDLTSDFEWDFGDGANTAGPTVSHVFEEPGGYVVQLTITDQLGCKNTNFLSQRIRVAPRPDFEIASALGQICSGDTVQLNAMVDSLDANHTVSVGPGTGGFQVSGIRSDSLPLPDGNGSSYQTTISFSDFSPGQLLTDINDLEGIWVNMEHSWMRDLQINLTCPNGQSAILHDHPGQTGGEVFLGIPFENDENLIEPIPGTGADYGWQVNPDYSYTWIEYANVFVPSTLPSGSYESFEPLENFLGCPLNGAWTIEVTDLWQIDNGFIFSWSIDFNQDLYPEIETFSPSLVDWEWNDHPSVFFETPDSIAAAPANAGEVAYSFTVNDEFGCTWDTSISIQVLPFLHPDCYSCADLISPLPDTTICNGDMVQLNVESPVSDPEITFESYDDYPIGAGNHPPANPYSSTINVNSISPATINDPLVDIVSICLDLETDFDADIQLFIESPSGQMMALSTNNGGSGDNYTQTCFTPTAAQNIALASAPFTGNFQPEGNWAFLTGSPINGAWSLRVSDQFAPNVFGNLNWWSITFRSANEIEYSWSNTATLSCNDCPDPMASPTNSTNYVVTANDQMGCQTDQPVNVNVLNLFDAPTVQCQDMIGGKIKVEWNDQNPGATYEINVNGTGWVPPNNGGLSHIIDGLVIGSQVDVEVRVAVSGTTCIAAIGTSSCQYLLCPLDIVPNPAPPYFVSCTDDCDGALQLDVFNGVLPFSFNVTNTDTGDSFTQTNGNLSGLCVGNYQVVVTDATGCAETFLFEIMNPGPLIVTAVQDSPVSCFGGSDGTASATASGGTGTITFMWSDLNMTVGQQIANLPAGPITVTATDANGCQASATATIGQNDAVTLGFTATPVNCLGGNDGTATVLPTGGTGAYTYQWSGGATPSEQTATALESGNYSVTVEDSNGCQAFGNVDVGEPMDGLVISASQTVRSCFGLNQSEATATANGGTPPYSYSWFPSGQTDPTATGLPVGVFTVEVTDALGCTAEESVSIEQWDMIDISMAATPPTCFDGSDGAMGVIQTTGGAGTYSYQWNNGDQDDFINGLQGGLLYTVTVSDMQGCEGVKSRLLENPPRMEPTAEITDALCNGSQDGTVLIAGVDNANGNVSFQWDAAANNQTSAMAFDLGAGTYSVVITDDNDCQITEIYEVKEPDAIEVDFTATDNDCFGAMEGAVDTDVTGGTPGYNFLWSNNATSGKLTNILSGIYFVSITDSHGCLKEDSVFVDQPDPVFINIEVNDVSCFGEMDGSITINTTGGTPPFTYSLDNDRFFGSNTLIALVADDYPVFLMDAKDCLYTSNTTVNEPPPLSVSIIGNGVDTSELVINSGEEIQLDADVTNAIGLVNYEWTAGWCGTLSCANDTTDCGTDIACSDPVAFTDFTNDYFLLIEDEHGCKAEDHLQVHVRKVRSVVVPTGFTPNGDGTNDLLPVHGRSGTMIDLFQVFDRWGELLYQDTELPINDTSRGWDGTFKSQDMPSGVYIWYVEATYADGMTESFKGETTLIR